MGDGAALLADVRSYVEHLAESGTGELSVSLDVFSDLQGGLEAAAVAAPAVSPSTEPVVAPGAAPAAAAGGVAPQRDAELVSDEPDSMARLVSEIGACDACALRDGAGVVLGQGRQAAPEIMFIASSPSADAALKGDVYADAPGQLLAKMIGAMGLGVDEVYVTYVCKCSPVSGRKPTPTQLHACLPYMEREIAMVKPKVIVAMGALTVNALVELPAGRTFKDVRGQWLRVGKVAVMPTFQPSDLIQEPANKRPAWVDLQSALAHIGRTPPAR